MSSEKNCSVEDLKMEYKMKYERLLDLYNDSVQTFANLGQSGEVHREAYQNYVNELKKVGFEKDMKIYSLEEEVANLQSRNAELQKRCSELESIGPQNNNSDANKSLQSSIAFSSTRKNKQLVSETPIMLTSVPKVDIVSPLFLPETPRRVSRYRRHSMMQEALEKATPEDKDEKFAFLENIIIRQKDLLDFYATVSGFIAENLNDKTTDSQCGVDFFKMRPQSNILKDMELHFLVDYDGDDIEYRPANIPNEVTERLEKIAPFLEETLYFPSEDAPKLFKTLLDIIES